MSNQILFPRALDANGYIAPGAKATVYQSGTDTLISIYSDTAGTIAAANPVVADGDGVFPQRYANVAARVAYTTAADETLYTQDPAPAIPATGAGASQISFAPVPGVPVANVQDAIEYVATKTSQYISIKDFGAVGDGVTNDTVAVQNAINSAAVSGATLFAPAGNYFCPGGLTFVYTTLLYGKPVMVGEGASNTRFSTNTNTTLISISGTWGASEQQRNQFEGFSVNYTGATSTGFGVAVSQLSYCGFSDIAVNGFSKGLRASDVICATFFKCMFVANSVGVEGVRTSFTNANAWAFIGCTINGNTLRGIQLNKAATLSLDSCTLEGNGTMAVSETYGVYMNGNPNEGGAGLTARNCYFEGNKGEADVCIDTNDADGAVHSFIGCTFNRISSTDYVTNSIKLMKGGTGFMGLTVTGCGFRSFNTYVPNAARRCIAFVGALANRLYQVTLTGNYFADSVEIPNIGGVGSSQKAFTGAWVRFVGATGVISKSHNVASVSRSSTGVYVITFSQPFASSSHSVSVAPIGVLGFGALTDETADTITVSTYNGSSVLTDWPAVAVTVHSE